MSATKPFGDLLTAKVLVVGHDPRLQKSLAEAEFAFFFEYLKRHDEYPTYSPDAKKYGLAKAVWDYISELADQQLPRKRKSSFLEGLWSAISPSEHSCSACFACKDVAHSTTLYSIR
jgi:hypothetical protein